MYLEWNITFCAILIHGCYQASVNFRHDRIKPTSGNKSEDTKFLLEILKTCNFEDMILVSSADTSCQWCEHVLNMLRIHNFNLVHLEIFEADIGVAWLEKRIWDLCLNQKVTNFVLVTKKPEIVIRQAEKVFEKNHRGLGALMPHNIKFLIMFVGEYPKNLETQLVTTKFDNVAILMLHEETLGLQDVFALMWKENKKRKFEKIRFSDPDQNAPDLTSCHVFPNVHHGLNGRVLVGIAKEWSFFITRTPSPSTGKLQYSGYEINLMATVAKHLNFTLAIVPEAEKDDTISWDKYTSMVSNSEVDFSINSYLSYGNEVYNVSRAFPHHYGSFSGYYVYKETHSMFFPFTLVDTWIYVLLVISMFFTICFYNFLNGISVEKFDGAKDRNKTRNTKYSTKRQRNGDSSRPTFNTFIGKNDTKKLDDQNNIDQRLCVTTDQQVTSVHTEQDIMRPKKADFNGEKNGTYQDADFFVNDGNTDEEVNKTYPRHESKKKSILLYVRLAIQEFDATIFFQFVGSIFNQGTLPTPSRLSARLLLYSWSFMLIVCIATFNGYFTANLVRKTSDQLPFTTYEELISQEDYEWGCLESSSVIQLMKASEKGTIYRELYEGMERFENDTEIGFPLLEMGEKIRSGKFVAFLNSFSWQFLKSRQNFSNVIEMKNRLISTQGSVIFPPHSELSRPVSTVMIQLFERGITTKLFNAATANHSEKENNFDVSDSESKSLSVDYIEGTVYACICLLVAAAVALFAEVVYARMKTGAWFGCRSRSRNEKLKLKFKANDQMDSLS